MGKYLGMIICLKFAHMNNITNIIFYTDAHAYICSYYLGATPVFVITDPELAKSVLVKQFDHFTERLSFFTERLTALCSM